MNKDKPFLQIDFVVGLDLPDAPGADSTKPNRVIDCPFCNRRKKLNLDRTTNKWRCPACDKQGNSTTLHAMLTGLDNKAAYHDLEERYGNTSESERITFAVPHIEEPEYTAAPIALRNDVYRKLIDNATLSAKHKSNLRKRGLTDQEIESLPLQTLPCVGTATVAEKCIDSYVEAKIREKKWGIPGFYLNDENKYQLVRLKSPMMIPVINRGGLISQIELRNNDLMPYATDKQKEDFVRYKKLSSGDKEGGVSVSGLENIHYSRFDFDSEQTPENVVLTEGALKATIASTISQGSFIAVLGVSAQGNLSDELKYLKEHGTKRVFIAFDMDYRDKTEVKQQLLNAKQKVLSAGLNVVTLKWSTQYKGIDDFLAARRKYWEQKTKEKN